MNLREHPVTPGVFLGIGVMAAVDEIIFHQLLAWHHFYDQATPTIGLLSDGLLHALELLLLVGGFFLLLEQRRLQRSHATAVGGGFFVGAGGFQLFDGLINHKVLRLHQIRYNVDVLPYDIAWNTGASIMVLIGLWILLRRKRHGH